MATAGSVTVDQTGGKIYIAAPNRGCTTFLVRCEATSASPCQVRVDGLHDEGDWFLIPKGDKYTFRLFDGGIRTVWARGVGGSADISYAVVAQTTSYG